MSDLRNLVNTAGDADKTNDLESLTALVEAQIGDVLGGGYSQYSAVHGKDAAL
jgi:hypothetical protein